ncbi:hypothetical protein R1sor_001011 [Riccia sorocarpa]|uniref:Uncharacterized protein n=1 Tax=Riccia sorocarpa TaxID=122646 RepID=A0ABD3GYQ7_9MARC
MDKLNESRVLEKRLARSRQAFESRAEEDRAQVSFGEFVRILEQGGPSAVQQIPEPDVQDKGKHLMEEPQSEMPQPKRQPPATFGLHMGESSRPPAEQHTADAVSQVLDLPPKTAPMSSPNVVVIAPTSAPPPHVVDLSTFGSCVGSVSVREIERLRTSLAQSGDSELHVLDGAPQGFPHIPPRVVRHGYARQRRVLKRIHERRAQEQMLEQVEDRVYYIVEDGVAYTRPELLGHDCVHPRPRMRGRVRRGGVWGEVRRY